MTRKQRWITAAILIALVAISFAATLWVLDKQRPEAVAAFENRFIKAEQLGMRAMGEIAIATSDGAVSLSWQKHEADNELWAETADVSLAQPALNKIRLCVYAGGSQNARMFKRWGMRVWLELTALKAGEVIGSSEIELPFESDKQRLRACTVETDAAGADAWRVRVRLSPVDGKIAAGEMKLDAWEVYAR